MSEYERLLEEAKTKVEEGREKVRQTAERYIPKLYQALCDEWHTPQQAKKKIYKDCKDLWARDTISRLIPAEAKNQKQAQGARNANKNRVAAKLGKNPSSEITIVEPITITTNGHESEGGSNDVSIADSSAIRLPIKLNLRLYFPAIAQCWRAQRESVTLIHNGSEVVEVDYLGK